MIWRGRHHHPRQDRTPSAYERLPAPPDAQTAADKAGAMVAPAQPPSAGPRWAGGPTKRPGHGPTKSFIGGAAAYLPQAHHPARSRTSTTPFCSCRANGREALEGGLRLLPPRRRTWSTARLGGRREAGRHSRAGRREARSRLRRPPPANDDRQRRRGGAPGGRAAAPGGQPLRRPAGADMEAVIDGCAHGHREDPPTGRLGRAAPLLLSRGQRRRPECASRYLRLLAGRIAEAARRLRPFDLGAWRCS